MNWFDEYSFNSPLKISNIHKNVAIHGHFMVIGKIYFFDFGKTTTCFITNRTEMK